MKVILFLIIIIVLGCILGLLLSRFNRTEKFGLPTLSLPTLSFLISRALMKDLREAAHKQYSAIKGAENGVITAIQSDKYINFFLYVRLKDGSIIKQPINMYYSKIDAFPQSLQQSLLDGKEIVIDKIT